MSLTTEEEISSAAIEAMLFEVAATPKPGLVDRNNSGAHSDMDLYTFISSASVIQPFFTTMGIEGSMFKGNDFTALLKKIRPIGVQAEERMFKATADVNTHKGLIFSLGILCTATSYLISQEQELKAENICRIASLMCVNIVKDELEHSENNKTTGEKLYRNNGVKGIRGEAEAGYPSVLNHSLLYLRKSEGEWNKRLINTFFHLMANVEDSNVLGRHNHEVLQSVQDRAGEVLTQGGAFNETAMAKIGQMDIDFIEQNISPGGSADLLAVTIFLYTIETGEYTELKSK